MSISVETLKRIFLFLSLFYYAGFLAFFSRLLLGGKGDDLMGASASGNMPKQILGILLLLFGIVLLLRENKQFLFQTLRASYAWALLIGYFIVSIYWSYEPSISMRKLVAFITLLVTAYALVKFFTAETLLLFIANTIFWVAILGLIYVVIEPGQALEGEGARANTFRGIIADKNAGARFYTYGILILVGLGQYRAFRQKCVLAVLFFCIVMANSATAIVMLISGLGLIYLLNALRTNSPTINLQRFVLICTLMLGATVVAAYLYEFLLSALGRDPTLTNRTIIWELLDSYIDDEYWYGYGFGAFWVSDAVLSFVDRWGYIGNAHSGYYEALLHGGVIGLSLVIFVILKTLKDLIRSYITHPQGNLVAALMGIVLLQSVVNFVGFIVINHNSHDMFVFAVVSFISAFLIVERRVPRLRNLVSRNSTQGANAF